MLATVRNNPSLSRVDLSRMTGLAPSSITFIVNRLKRDRILIEEKMENHSPVGRRPTALRIRPEAMMAIGVEVTRGETRLLLADLDGRMLQQRTVPWHDNHQVLFSRVHSAIAALCQHAKSSRLLGVGVALPGLMDPGTGKIFVAQNFDWFNVDAGDLIRKNLQLPFYFENNARLSALAERWSGGPDRNSLRNFVFVVAREGVGTGVIIDGQILHGARAAAGEFGHATLYPGGKRCLCGNLGCWEQYVSDTALVDLFLSVGGERSTGTEPLTGLSVARMAIGGHGLAREALRRIAVPVGEGLTNVIRALNPEAIVVGDYLAVGWDLMHDVVWDVLRKHVHQYYLSDLRIFPSEHATDSSLLGGVALVLSRFLTTLDEAENGAAPNSVLLSSSGV